MKESIEEQGIQEAIKILPDGAIIDGYHRKKIAQGLGIKDIPYETKRLNKDKALELGISLNLARRNLSFEQKREIIEKLRKKGWVQEKIANLIGISRRTLDRLEKGSNGQMDNTAILDLRYKISKEQEDDIKVSDATVYFAIQFYIKWPELSNAFESFEEGKNDNTGRMLRLIFEESYTEFAFARTGNTYKLKQERG
ncbi:hypothetical protein ES695_13850 [Candidatus Atribacteria bacterium 1244-E10-H5-B2]|nr:MAG: hypothetical protein ES695_13850 [Candidatus Atribacteria bacterium 1244-E10-H5-B2]